MYYSFYFPCNYKNRVLASFQTRAVKCVCARRCYRLKSFFFLVLVRNIAFDELNDKNKLRYKNSYLTLYFIKSSLQKTFDQNLNSGKRDHRIILMIAAFMSRYMIEKLGKWGYLDNGDAILDYIYEKKKQFIK